MAAQEPIDALYTAGQVRAAEAPLLAALPGGTLMRRAAHGLATVVARELRAHAGRIAGSAVTVLVGAGDNGGDGLWAGALLRRRGVAVTAVLLDPARAHPAGAAALRAAGGHLLPAEEPGGTVSAAALAAAAQADLVLDAIVGIGGRGPLRPTAADLVARVRAPIVAVDLPSGVDPDTGAVAGPAVRAALTVTFGAVKPALLLAAERCGRVAVIDIGLDLPAPHARVLTDAAVGALWPVPTGADDKYSQGVVGVVAGSPGYPGAAVLAVGGALAATSGLVRYAGPEHAAVVRAHPEAVVADSVAHTQRVQAWVVGPGMGTGPVAERIVARLAATDLPLLIDADAVTVLARRPELVCGRRAPTVLTPHDREFARLAGRPVGADRIGAAHELAAQLSATVLLKGRATIIAGPDGDTVVSEAGGSWAATAGSGDVLSGMIGALLAVGLAPVTAAAAADRVHAIAARAAALGAGAGDAHAAGAPIHAGQITAQIPAAVRRVRSAAAHRGGTMTHRD